MTENKSDELTSERGM